MSSALKYSFKCFLTQTWTRNLLHLKRIKLQTGLQSCEFHQSEGNNHDEIDVGNRNNGPLSGLRVLDLSRVLAGPYCTMILGDLGAEIIKVEKPGSGDDTRSWGPPFVGSESVYFMTINRNKKSVAINIKSTKGQELLQKLAQESDILVENYIPGQLEKFKLSYEDIREIAPQLIYCSISGYGQTGPYARRAGYDVIVSAVGGLMHITGPKDGEPCKVGVAMTDLSTGLYAHGAILAAILHRQKTGLGQHIDCNLYSTQVASLVNIAGNYLNAGIEAKRHGTAHPSIVPYQAFKTSDSYMVVGAGNDGQFQQLCKFLNIDHVAKDPKYSKNENRVANREELLSLLQSIFTKQTTKEWLAVFENSGIPYGPINNMEEVFSDPQTLHNGMLQSMQHPKAGTIKVAGPAVRYSDSPVVDPVSPPLLGQHTRPVLKDILGVSDEELSQLESDKIIQSSK